MVKELLRNQANKTVVIIMKIKFQLIGIIRSNCLGNKTLIYELKRMLQIAFINKC